MLLDPNSETKSRSELQALQNEKLAQLIRWVYEKNLFYRARMEANGLQPEDIQDIAQLSRLPLTSFQDIRAGFPYGLLTLPTSGVSGVHMKDGAAMCYSSHDIEGWKPVLARLFAAGGVNRTGVFQNVWPGTELSQVILHEGVRQLGAVLAPAHREDMGRQVQLMQDFGVTALYGNPEYLLSLARYISTEGSNPYQLPLQVLFCSMEELDEASRTELQIAFGVKVMALYGLDSILGVAIAGECHLPDGLHLQEDCMYGEIVNETTGEVLPEGQPGELVITTLSLEAMPLLRYRTGVQAVLDYRPCHCGRTFARIRRY